MTDKERILILIDELIKEAQEAPQWKAESALRCLKKELLEEQESVEPVLDIDTWKCRNCGHDLEHQEMLGDNVLFHEQYNYCPNCGKKVKWDET